MPSTRWGLQSKIIIIIAVTVISVVAVSTAIAMFLTQQLVEEEIYRKALAQSRATAHQLVSEDALEDPQKLLALLNQVQRDTPGVRQADVYLHGQNNLLAASTVPAGQHLELDHLAGVESYFEFERPEEDAVTIETADSKFWIMGTTIRDQGRPVGCLNLKVSKSQSSRVTRALVARNVWLMVASLAVVILVIHLFFLRRVRRPVKEMVRVMESAESGQLDVRAAVKSGDEIAQLAEHLNRMLARIENFSGELARKVEEATQELRRINQELFETQKNLARSERLAVAGQLAASLAHEIGTPLNSISGHVELLARHKVWDESADRRLEVIEKQIEKIVRTVKQLLSWTRKFDLRIEPVNLRRILEESLLLSSAALQLRKIKVRTELAPDCPVIYCDASYLEQVFLNLINNSMDAMPHGGELKVSLRYPANGSRGEVAVEIADTGVGMAPETLAQIFDPTFTTKRLGTGAGLGLALCDQIVRQHAGTIQVESGPQRGTRFTIVLPVDCREKLETMAAVPAGSSGDSGG